MNTKRYQVVVCCAFLMAAAATCAAQAITITAAGGMGGNAKQILTYDGQVTQPDSDGKPRHRPSLSLKRDSESAICYLANNEIEIYDGRDVSQIMHFPCLQPDTEHQLYWNGAMDTANEGISPANDALFAATIVNAMYRTWFNIPMLKLASGAPMILKIEPHTGQQWENATWNTMKHVVQLGDGDDYIYPLSSLDVVAHEIGHAYTDQHSGLISRGESGAIDESFADMMAQAVEFYATGNTTWQIGATVVKNSNEPLRYMDQPSKDCHGRAPGDQCSIDDMSSYKPALGEHYTCGIYNRMFYLLATSPGWNVEKAIKVMMQANAFYWTKKTTLVSGACGVMSAAKDLQEDASAVARAFEEVKIDVTQC